MRAQSGIFAFAAVFAFAAISATGCRKQTDSGVNFRIDMTSQIADGTFDPAADSVGVRGDAKPLSWGRSIMSVDDDGDGIYEVTIDFPMESQLPIAYKFKLEGPHFRNNAGWEDGRNRAFDAATDRVIERAFNSEPDVIEHTVTGTVLTHEDFPSAFVLPRNIYVYLPPGYGNTTASYPVLYMHDGQNIFDAWSAGAEWQLDEHAQELIESGDIPPMIIVGVGNTNQRTYEYTPSESQQVMVFDRETPVDPHVYDGLYRSGDAMIRVVSSPDTLRMIDVDTGEERLGIRTADDTYRIDGTAMTARFSRADGVATGFTASSAPEGGGGDAYGQFLIEELKPFIDKTYRTLPDANDTGLGGSSFGGLITLHVGLEHPDVYGTLLVVSPSVWWDNRFILEEVQSLKSSTGQRIWLDMGADEGKEMVDGAEVLHSLLLKKGWTESTLSFVIAPDANHSERAWAARSAEMLRFFGRSVRGE